MKNSEIKKGYADYSGGQIHYRATPMRDGLPIVCLHQTASSSAMFENLMRRLSEKYWLIAPDTPGFGNSDPLGRATVGGFADAVFECLSSLGVDECWLFGHHTGAAIAVQLITDHPKLAKKVYLSGPPLISDEIKSRLIESLTPTDLSPDGKHLTRTWARIQGRFPTTSIDLVHRETILSLQAGDNYSAAYHAVFEQDFGGQLANITIPVLVSSGENDTLRAGLEPAYRLLLNGRMAVIPGAATYVCDTHPNELAALMEDFFIGA